MTTVGESVEVREDIPLKSGSKSSSKWWRCNEDCLGGSQFINVAFATLTIVITIALLIQIYYGDYQVVPHGSVATDSLECSKIGTLILKKGGNSVDAAIASAFCLAVVTPHVTGLDAEGQLLIYNHRTRLAPNVIDFSGTDYGEAAATLPRLVLGLAYTYQQYGTLPWRSLVQPAADMAKKGFLIPKMLVQAISQSEAEDLYGRLEPGQILQLEVLGSTLDKIANISEKDLYSIVDRSKQPMTSQALKSTFNNYDIYVPNAPSIGPILLTNLERIQEHSFSVSDTNGPEYIYRLAKITQDIHNESSVWLKYHEGTSSNVAVIDLDDNYVSLVTGMYGLFGSGEMTSDGYVRDVKVKERPCSRLPIIITDRNIICGRRMVFGSNDIAIASQLIASLLIAKENATDSIEAARFHILKSGSVTIEGSHSPRFSNDVFMYLDTLASINQTMMPEPYYSSNIVEKIKDDLNSHSDSRGGGIASRF